MRASRLDSISRKGLAEQKAQLSRVKTKKGHKGEKSEMPRNSHVFIGRYKDFLITRICTALVAFQSKKMK